MPKKFTAFTTFKVCKSVHHHVSNKSTNQMQQFLKFIA